MRYYASQLPTMAEEDTKKISEKDNHRDVQALPQKESRPRKSSLKKTNTGDKVTTAQTPAQVEAAKESQMHETFHDARGESPTTTQKDVGLSKETGGASNNQNLDRSSTSLSGENARPELEKPARKEDLFPGDEVIPDAVMVYDQKRTIRAPAEDIFPWLLQLGKNRGGWYLPLRVEGIIPFTWRPSRTIESKWQRLTPGERIPDYGFGRNDHFVVARVEEPHTIVLRSRRYGCDFTWALLLRELHDQPSDPEPATVVHLRFRGKIKAEGFKRRVVVKSGQVLDKLSTTPMLAGLAERCEQPGQLEKEKAKLSEKPQRRSFAGLRPFSKSTPEPESNPRNSVA